MMRTVWSAVLGVVAGCAPQRPLHCFGFQSRAWHLDMTSDKTGLSLDALLTPVGNHQLRVSGTMTTGEGTKEPLDYPVDSLVVWGDSLRFSFAPLGITVVGHCLQDGTITGRFVVPQPPYGPIVGTGTLRRQ